jgi:hypothetical protein
MKSVLTLLLLLSAPVFAAPDAGFSCSEVEQRLGAAQRTLAHCTDGSRSLTQARERCEAELAETDDRLGANTLRLESCLNVKEQLCQEAASFASSLLTGRARGVGACVSAESQRQLQTLLDGWSALAKNLVQLDEYVSGVSDVVPHPGANTEPERRLGRVLGVRHGSPLWNRRLLIQAFRLTAPNTWEHLKAQGLVAIDAFFDSRGPLPEALMTEAQGEHPEPPGPAGPPLSAALKLTLSYLEIAGCEERQSPQDCGRARQLVELLDNTGPLIVRRRVEEMWATPCATLNPDTVRAWLQDFPVSHREKGQATLGELASAARSKLYLCYLADAEGKASYRTWALARLPAPTVLDSHTLALVDGFASFVHDGDAVDRCGRAVKALQRLEVNESCSVGQPEVLAVVANWARTKAPANAPPELEVCQRVASLLWSGAAITIADDFSHPPTPAEMVREDSKESDTPVARLRANCDERQGTGVRFEQSLVSLAHVARDVGESVVTSPWRLDPTGSRPLELSRLSAAESYPFWAQHLMSQSSVCEALGLSPSRCDACREQGAGTQYDCDVAFELEQSWARHRRMTIAATFAVGAVLLALLWVLRLRRAQRVFTESMRTARENFEALGVLATADGWRLLLPSRHDVLRLELPHTPAWERWGTRACAVLAPGEGALREADVNHAAAVALREDVHVVFVLHADSATPDLGAVRATLDWAARGGTRAVQVLPLAISRLAWATREEDLLDLIEQTTLRGNPFEVRGPVRSSSQFWNRERLVAGLLTESRAGNWVVVTGLRRFGKSSLALEVARRTTGPSAYVDLAGFHHEVSFGETPAVAVEAILRTLVMRLSDSTTARYPAAVVPPLPSGSLDAPTLAAWLRALATACGTSSGSPPPSMLLVVDEVEQLLSVDPQRMERALAVLATLTGRLRSAFSEPSSPHAGNTVGVVLCAAMHPLLWAPLATLGGQSIMGAFPSICVPCLDDDAALAMMRGLGAQQGIRFEDDALEALVRASQGVPLLLRRLGTSVLELYDADRARQGALGAVRIGIEGANEAIRREERGGSPLRVWVESEIAQADTSAGILLRALAQADRVPVASLQRMVEIKVMERFAATGLTDHLAPAELKRRAQEAASVMVRLLAESKLLQLHGDLTSPEAYSLPDGVLRRILK